MHYTQNEKIAQVGKDSLVIGIDVGSEKQFARAFGPSQIEYTRKAFSFINSAEGFDQFLKWAQDIQLKKGLKMVLHKRQFRGQIHTGESMSASFFQRA